MAYDNPILFNGALLTEFVSWLGFNGPFKFRSHRAFKVELYYKY